MLYQRYKKFDQSSYSISNVTFYNLFAAESVRMGRYKVPQTEEVILCLTDPLTTSEMKRYFNSIHALKFFKSKFMQQKRKRQYVMPVLTNNDFFQQAVFNMEYGRTVLDDKVGGSAAKGLASVVCPLSVFKDDFSISGSSSRFENNFEFSNNFDSYEEKKERNDENDNENKNENKNENENQDRNESKKGDLIICNKDVDDNEDNVVGLKVSVRVANGQYFMENLMQSILTFITLKNNKLKNKNFTDREIILKFDNENKKRENIEKIELLDKKDLSSFSILFGGDGRILNEHATEIGIRVCAGNNIPIISVSQNLFLTTTAAIAFLKQKSRTSTTGTYICISFLWLDILFRIMTFIYFFIGLYLFASRF